MLRRKREYEAIKKSSFDIDREQTIDITRPEAELLLSGMGKLKVKK